VLNRVNVRAKQRQPLGRLTLGLHVVVMALVSLSPYFTHISYHFRRKRAFCRHSTVFGALKPENLNDISTCSVYITREHNGLCNKNQQRELNPLTPNDPYRGRTAPLTSKRCILYIYSTNIGTECFKHVIYFPFFLFKMQFVS